MGNTGSWRTIVGTLVLAFILILLLLQVTIEIIAWNILLGLWLLTWPALITVLVGVVGLVLLVRRRRILVAGLWIALVVIGFVGVRFALNNVGGDILIPTGGPVADWPVYGRDPPGSRYSPLAQINRYNMSHLEIAWEYHTGDFSDGSDGLQKTSFQATPIMVAGVLYVSTIYGKVIALDPETGTGLWTYNPQMDISVRRSETASRGVVMWLMAAVMLVAPASAGSSSEHLTRG